MACEAEQALKNATAQALATALSMQAANAVVDQALVDLCEAADDAAGDLLAACVAEHGPPG